MIQSWDVKCSACPRTFSMSLNTLGQRKTCTFCGGSLVIPPEMKQAADAAIVARSPTRLTTIACPLCLRNVPTQNPIAGRTYTCGYCTCRYVLDSSFRASPEPSPLPFPDAVHQAIARLGCGNCKLAKLKPDENAPASAKCTSCGAAQSLFGLPLNKLVELPPSSSPLMESACTAILARWERGDIGLAEAWWILEELGGIDRALSSGGSLLEQLSPKIAADVVQYGIFGAPSAEVHSYEDRITLTVLDTAGRGRTTDVNITGTIAMNVIGIGLLATTGRGFIGVKRDSSEGRMADPALLLHFIYTDVGSALHADVRNTDGNVTPLPAAELRKLTHDISKQLPDAVRRLYVFKAIFGNWITGSMLYGMPASALKTRLQSLGGTLEIRADALATALTQLPKSAAK